MDSEPYDSSGTDDDIPSSHQNKIPRAGRVPVNGRTSVKGSVPYPRMHNDSNMEAKIHELEREAYISILRAFKAQADAITWEKETLITELRKELRMSNEEHRELLGRANADDVIKKIREWRQSVGNQQGTIHTGQPVFDPVPIPSVSASRKKQKTAPSMRSQSFGGPPPFQPQPVAPASHPSPATAKRGLMVGPNGKKRKPSQMLPDVPPTKGQYPSSGPNGKSQMLPGVPPTKGQYPSGPNGKSQMLSGVPPTKGQYPSSGPNGRVQAGSHMSTSTYASELAGAATFSPLIGRKVRTRWPDDNSFYEAVITDYNAVEDRHALVYDMGTPNETWEWIKFSEMAPKDIQWEDEDPAIYNNGCSGGTGHGMNRPVRRDSGAGRGREMTKGHPQKDFQPSQNCVVKKAPEDIKLLNTNTLIKEVERVFSSNHPDPLEIEEAKKVLKEHEQALADAIARLTDLSDGEDGGRGFMHGRAMIEKNSRQIR